MRWQLENHPELYDGLRTAFTALETWTASGQAPPKSATLPRPDGDLFNSCSLRA